MKTTITLCSTPRERQQFENVAEDLLRNDPQFVPPFPGSIAKYLSPKSVFHRIHGEIHPLIAWRDGHAVGRIAAIINRTHNSYYHDQVGFFGFFDCENNPDTAALLFARAAEILHSHGLTSIRGPYNPSINDECGLLTEGFDQPTMLGMTWNPPYYENLLTASGLPAVRTLYGFDLPLHRLQVPERLRRITERLAKRAHLKLRPINFKSLRRDMEIFREVYNSTLERNWGFIPISMEDLMGAADDLKAIADPQMFLIAELDGENAGAAMSLPNFNEILAQAKNTPRWLRLLHIVWLMKTYRIQSVRQTVYGISPRFRDRGGLHAYLMQEQLRVGIERYQGAQLGWIEENNTEIISNSEMLGGSHNRTWKLFEKALA